MSEQLLSLLRIGLLGLLYLFFGRVLWAVWSEVRTPRRAATTGDSGLAPAAEQRITATPAAPTSGRRNPIHRSTVSKLVVLAPKARKGETFGLDHEVMVGRSAACRLVLDDDTFVSQLHARAHHDGQGAWIEDLGSTNGTFLNGTRIQGSHTLASGDRVAIGQAVLEAR